MRQSLKFAMCVVVSAALGLGTAAACFDDDGGGVATPTVLPATIAAPTEEPDPTSTPPPAMTLETKVGQLVMSGMSGTTADEAAALVREYHIGNLALLGANVGAPEDVRALTSGLQALAIEANGVGMLLSIDQEGGRVIRLDPPFVQMPAAAVIGCIGETQFARQAGLVTGREMRAVGINMNLAPDADVLTNPENKVIGDRAFGTTPDVVTPMVLAYIEGLHQAGALATVKHFPGHGSTDGAGGDSHDGRVVVAKTLAELESDDLPPFRAAAATTDLMMTSNVDYTTLDPAGIPASLSALTIAFLRNGVGFQGVIVTDALEMGAVSNRWEAGEAAVRAIEAGADMALYASTDGGIAAAEALLAAVQSGRISEARIDESVSRVLALKGRALGVPAPGIDVVGSAEHTAFVELLGTAALERGC